MPFISIHRFRILLLFSRTILRVGTFGVRILLGEINFSLLRTIVSELWSSPCFFCEAQACFSGRMTEGLWPWLPYTIKRMVKNVYIQYVQYPSSPVSLIVAWCLTTINRFEILVCRNRKLGPGICCRSDVELWPPGVGTNVFTSLAIIHKKECSSG